MFPISAIRQYIGEERFDAAMKVARKRLESGEPIVPISRTLRERMHREPPSRGISIKRAAEILAQAVTFKFKLPKPQDWWK